MRLQIESVLADLGLRDSHTADYSALALHSLELLHRTTGERLEQTFGEAAAPLLLLIAADDLARRGEKDAAEKSYAALATGELPPRILSQIGYILLERAGSPEIPSSEADCEDDPAFEWAEPDAPLLAEPLRTGPVDIEPARLLLIAAQAFTLAALQLSHQSDNETFDSYDAWPMWFALDGFRAACKALTHEAGLQAVVADFGAWRGAYDEGVETGPPEAVLINFAETSGFLAGLEAGRGHGWIAEPTDSNVAVQVRQILHHIRALSSRVQDGTPSVGLDVEQLSLGLASRLAHELSKAPTFVVERAEAVLRQNFPGFSGLPSDVQRLLGQAEWLCESFSNAPDAEWGPVVMQYARVVEGLLRQRFHRLDQAQPLSPRLARVQWRFATLGEFERLLEEQQFVLRLRRLGAPADAIDSLRRAVTEVNRSRRKAAHGLELTHVQEALALRRLVVGGTPEVRGLVWLLTADIPILP